MNVTWDIELARKRGWSRVLMGALMLGFVAFAATVIVVPDWNNQAANPTDHCGPTMSARAHKIAWVSVVLVAAGTYCAVSGLRNVLYARRLRKLPQPD